MVSKQPIGCGNQIVRLTSKEIWFRTVWMSLCIDSYMLYTIDKFRCCPSFTLFVTLILNASPMYNVIHTAIFSISMVVVQQKSSFAQIHELGHFEISWKYGIKFVKMGKFVIECDIIIINKRNTRNSLYEISNLLGNFYGSTILHLLNFFIHVDYINHFTFLNNEHWITWNQSI